MAVMPYFPFGLFDTSGSRLRILPNADARSCACLAYGSPPLPLSATPTYSSPYSGLPGLASGLNAISPPL